MACNSISLSGIGLGCKNNMGGIKEAYLIKESDVKSVELDSSKSQIASITLNESATFKTYKFRKGTSQFTSTMTTDEAAGTLSVQTDLALRFSQMETSKRLEIMAMCMDSLKAIVLDSNGRYWFLGYDFPISATAATGQTGTAMGDFGGYDVTLTDNSKEFPYELSEEAIAALTDSTNPQITAAPLV